MITSPLHIYAIWVRRFGFRRGNWDDFFVGGGLAICRRNGVIWCRGYVCFYSGVGNMCFMVVKEKCVFMNRFFGEK